MVSSFHHGLQFLPRFSIFTMVLQCYLCSPNFKSFILLTNMNKVQINLNKIHRYIAPDKLRSVFFITYSYILFLNHVLPILHICTAGSSSGWSHHLALGFLHRSTSRTTRFMTSSPTSWLDLSTFTSTWRSLRRWPVGWAARYLILRQPTGRIVYRFHCQLRWGFTS